ncbi:MAG TPA: porin [Nevskiaceae bacterium]|nr:porin [Nevskiaceae bacterium]
MTAPLFRRSAAFPARTTRAAWSFWTAGLTALGLLLTAAPARAETAAVDDTSPEALDQRLRILERQLELAREDQAAKAKDATTTRFDERGLSVKKGDFEFKLRGTAQADLRFFLDDSAPRSNDTLILRRLRPNFEFALGQLASFRLQPEFAGDATTVIDAHVDLRFTPAANIRVGLQKPPVGLERLVSASSLEFIERGFATELAPSRDLGVLLHGDLLGGTLNYGLGYFNGAPDGRNAPTTDGDNRKELAARLFAEPFKNDVGALQGLGFGLAYTQGNKLGEGNNFLPRYRTAGQNVFFQYQAATAASGTTAATPGVLASGEHLRLSPQFTFYRGAFGLLGEYITSEQEVTRGSAAGSFEHEAWNLYATYALTGEDASFRGIARPAQPFALGTSGWGAVELALRYGVLTLDDQVFVGDAATRFANPASSAREASSYTVGINWYLTSNAKLVLNYSNTGFEGGAAGGADREDEKALFTRFQVAF